jgi:hypothetical protein
VRIPARWFRLLKYMWFIIHVTQIECFYCFDQLQYG